MTYFLKNYWKQQPKLGSRDRKILGDMAYSWYRCSKGFDYKQDFDDKLAACLFLCEVQSPYTLQFVPEAWQKSKAAPIAQKMEILQAQGIRFDTNRIAPANISFSQGITRKEWIYALLQQPRLFIRVRDRELVPVLLQEHNIPFEWVNEHCMSIANGSPVDKILVEDSYVVQDASSQRTGDYFHPKNGEHWWDCCSGAGGKSLLLKDMNEHIELTVSDKRESVIHNLQQRFTQYHHGMPQTLVLNMKDTQAVHDAVGNMQFHHIICDAPCTGSGTWARTPEQLFFFKPAILPEMAALQTTIAVNAAQYLQPGGHLFYITCSVFEAENEAVVKNIREQAGLQLKEMHLLNGVAQKADSMFIAILEKIA